MMNRFNSIYCTVLVAIVLLDASLAVQSAAVDDAKGLTETIRGQVKKVVAKGEPKIRRTIRLREVPPSPPSQDAPVASANSTVNNEGPVNSIEVKPDISVSTNPEQKQESPVDKQPEVSSDRGDSNEKSKPKKKNKNKNKKGKGKKGKGKKGKSKDPSTDESPEDGDDNDGEEDKIGEPKEDTEKANPVAPIQVSQEQNLVQQKLNELPVTEAPATTTTTQAPSSDGDAKKTDGDKEKDGGSKESVYLADSNNVKHSVLNNVGNTETVEMNGVGNKKVIKMTDSNNQGTEQLDKKDSGTGCNHKHHPTTEVHHHYHNNSQEAKQASSEQPAVQVIIQAPEPTNVPQVAALPQATHAMIIGPQGAQMIQHPSGVLSNAGQMVMAHGSHVIQPMVQPPMMHHQPIMPVVHAPYGFAPMQPPVVPIPVPYAYPGYPQPPKSRKKKSKKNKKKKDKRNETTTTTTTPEPTTTTTTPEPTTTTTTPPPATTEWVEWEMVKVPRRKLKEVIKNGAGVIV